jgi:CheY-like chemotaxis protein
VFVVDDDLFSQDLLRQQLDSLGIKDVHVANDGRLGLSMLERMPVLPDYLICDVFMPNMDGIEFLGALAEQRYQGGVIMTSGGDAGIVHIAQELALANGLNILGTIFKPVTRAELAKLMSLDEML